MVKHSKTVVYYLFISRVGGSETVVYRIEVFVLSSKVITSGQRLHSGQGAPPAPPVPPPPQAERMTEEQLLQTMRDQFKHLSSSHPSTPAQARHAAAVAAAATATTAGMTGAVTKQRVEQPWRGKGWQTCSGA